MISPPGHVRPCHGTFATGQLRRLSLDGRGAQFVNAGHPWPLRLRDAAAQEVRVAIDPPFGFPQPVRQPRAGLPGCDRCLQPVLSD